MKACVDGLLKLCGGPRSVCDRHNFWGIGNFHKLKKRKESFIKSGEECLTLSHTPSGHVFMRVPGTVASTEFLLLHIRRPLTWNLLPRRPEELPKGELFRNHRLLGCVL